MISSDMPPCLIQVGASVMFAREALPRQLGRKRNEKVTTHMYVCTYKTCTSHGPFSWVFSLEQHNYLVFPGSALCARAKKKPSRDVER